MISSGWTSLKASLGLKSITKPRSLRSSGRSILSFNFVKNNYQTSAQFRRYVWYCLKTPHQILIPPADEGLQAAAKRIPRDNSGDGPTFSRPATCICLISGRSSFSWKLILVSRVLSERRRTQDRNLIFLFSSFEKSPASGTSSLEIKDHQKA